jgi:hypothetical protein
LLTTIGFAQEYRGEITGRITDPSGAAIAPASVEVQGIETNVVVRSSSNETGAYLVPFLQPGLYSLRVEHAGFKKLERSGIRVLTNQPMEVDLALQIGAASESITINAESPQLNTTNADLGQVVDKSYIGMVDVSLDRNIVNFKNLRRV